MLPFIQGVTSLLVVVAWTAQWHWYPGLLRVSASEFPACHARHIRRIVPLTAPLMLLEAAFFLKWWLGDPAHQDGWLAGLPLLVVWTNTFLLQVPRHLALTGRRSEAHLRGLLRSNLYRTLAWSLYAAWLWMGRPWPTG